MPAVRYLSRLILIAVLAAAIFGGFTHVRALTDWVKLRNYVAPANVAQLATQDTMTGYARHLFYVNHPVIESNVSQFRANCAQNEQTIVLGCYHGGDMGIEIYDVKDSRLAGVEQVTAAHEMLHAAYDRMSSKDKAGVDAMLEDYYKNDLTDQRVKDTIDAYKKSEPNDVVNEMHSVFGTEVPSLPGPLENYYKKYFSDRSRVTSYAANYEDEFTSRMNQIAADDQQLTQMKSQIQSEESDLDSQLASLQADRARIERSSSDSDVNQYNARVNAYNAGIRTLQNDIAVYNSLVSERNSIAADLQSLQSSLDTRLTTQAAQ